MDAASSSTGGRRWSRDVSMIFGGLFTGDILCSCTTQADLAGQLPSHLILSSSVVDTATKVHPGFLKDGCRCVCSGRVCSIIFRTALDEVAYRTYTLATVTKIKSMHLPSITQADPASLYSLSVEAWILAFSRISLQQIRYVITIFGSDCF